MLEEKTTPTAQSATHPQENPECRPSDYTNYLSHSGSLRKQTLSIQRHLKEAFGMFGLSLK